MVAFNAKPQRCVLVNLATFEQKQAQFNPRALTRSLKANYARLTVPGLSHQPLHYVNTGNTQLPSVEFVMDRAMDPSFDVADFLGFLRSLLLPPEPAGGVPQLAPPRVLFVWPNVLSIEAVGIDLTEQYDLFYADAGVRSAIGTITFEQILDFRITGDDVRSEVPLSSDQVESALAFVYGYEG